MSKKKSAGVTVTFRSPSFIHKGIKYLSKDIEAAATKGDETALRVIAELVTKGSGVVSVQEDSGEPAADTQPPKSPKRKKELAGNAETEKEAPDA